MYLSGRGYFSLIIMNISKFDPVGMSWGQSPIKQEHPFCVINGFEGLGWTRKKSIVKIVFLSLLS